MKVFWSWKSDIPGKTGRHFIREALSAAIEKLKEPEEIEEPQERELKDAMHLDQDRQGVPGSPDLAATIFKKIRETTVFVADVTPVAEGIEKEDKSKKKIMNPNVAIELGYALNCLGDNAVLMIMNTFYGKREDLPFDLAHKAGPILFHLPPNATEEEYEGQHSLLCGRLVQALRFYLKIKPTQAPEEAFEERASRKKREIDFEKSKKQFLSSELGVQSALKEVEKLFQTLKEKSEKSGFNIQLKQFQRVFCLQCDGIGMSVSWMGEYSNVLDGSYLEVELWKGTPPQLRNFRFDEAPRLSITKYNFDKIKTGDLGWTQIASGIPPFTPTEKLAEDCLDALIDRIHQNSLKKNDSY